MWKPNVVIVGPGGIKALTELSGFVVLERDGILSEMEEIVGISAGAIISLLHVCGYRAEEILKLAASTNILDGFVGVDPYRIINNFGFISNKFIEEKLCEMVKDKIGFVPTLKQLYEYSGITFTVVVTNIESINSTELINWKTSPEKNCIEGVLASINIPGLFEKFRMDGKLYVDGALSNPYPVNLYDDGKNKILGITIFSKTHGPIKNLLNYGERIIHITMDEMKKLIMNSSSKNCKHLIFEVDIQDPTGIGMDDIKKSEMVASGYATAERFVKNLMKTIKEKKQ